MAKGSWGREEFSPEGWAELDEAIAVSEAEYDRGEYVEYGAEDKEAFLAGVMARGRAALAEKQAG